MEVSSNSDPVPILRNACLQGVCSPVAGLNVMPGRTGNKSQSGPSKVWFLATELELTLPMPWPARLLLLRIVKKLVDCNSSTNVVIQSKPLGTGKPVSKEPGTGEPLVWKAV